MHKFRIIARTIAGAFGILALFVAAYAYLVLVAVTLGY